MSVPGRRTHRQRRACRPGRNKPSPGSTGWRAVEDAGAAARFGRGGEGGRSCRGALHRGVRASLLAGGEGGETGSD
jgi:hypothetical protein